MSVDASSRSPRYRLPIPDLSATQRDALRGLPAEIVSGLRVLRDEPPPLVTRPEVWDQIATDAIMLAIDGWAGRALDLGWSVFDLFGCAADPDGDDRLLGLAGRLTGRRVLAITSDSARIADATLRRLPRYQPAEVTLLWQYGRGTGRPLSAKHLGRGGQSR